MLLKLKIEGATPAQLQYKVGSMRKEYTEAVKWENNTSQGVERGTVKGNGFAL